MSGSWQHRVTRGPVNYHLQAARNAARDLAEQAGSIFPSKGQMVFKTVTDVAILGTILVSGALAAVHLWNALSAKHKEQHSPEPSGSGSVPPRRPAAHTAAFADGHGGRSFDDDDAHSR